MHISKTFWLLLVLVLLGCQRLPEIATGTKTDDRVEAAAFNGQSYRTANGGSGITLISSDELEYRIDNETILCKYSDQGGALRVIVTELGTQHVLYFRRVPNGLMSNNGKVYLNEVGLAELRRQEEIAHQQQMEAEAAAGRARVERQQQEAIASQREAEQRRVMDQLAQQKAEANRRATIKALEASACTEGEYNVTPRSELIFTLSAQRDCWTPWLVPENRHGGWNADESGDVLLQLMFTDGTLGKVVDDGPRKDWSPEAQREAGTLDSQLIRAVRFKSLKKQPVQITFKVK